VKNTWETRLSAPHLRHPDGGSRSDAADDPGVDGLADAKTPQMHAQYAPNGMAFVERACAPAEARMPESRATEPDQKTNQR
jgi:hypothetical protein